MSCMMEEYLKVFVSPKREKALQLFVILPLPLPSFFFRKFLYFIAKFRTMIVLKDSLNLCKFVPYKLGTFS